MNVQNPSEKKPLTDPTNRVVATFEDLEHAEAARRALLQKEFADQDIRLFHGEEAAAEIDASSKWFADTQIEIERFKRALAAGNAIVSVPVEDAAGRDEVDAIAREHGAAFITHFGKWVTKTVETDE